MTALFLREGQPGAVSPAPNGCRFTVGNDQVFPRGRRGGGVTVGYGSAIFVIVTINNIHYVTESAMQVKMVKPG